MDRGFERRAPPFQMVGAVFVAASASPVAVRPPLLAAARAVLLSPSPPPSLPRRPNPQSHKKRPPPLDHTTGRRRASPPIRLRALFRFAVCSDTRRRVTLRPRQFFFGAPFLNRPFHIHRRRKQIKQSSGTFEKLYPAQGRQPSRGSCLRHGWACFFFPLPLLSERDHSSQLCPFSVLEKTSQRIAHELK
jgi:hypothetical protein